MRARWVAVLLIFVACREAETRTQTVVSIEAEPLAMAALTHVNVTLTSLDGTSTRELTSDGAWPIKLVVAPKNEDATRRFMLDVSARGDDDVERVGFRLTTGFVAHDVRYASITITDACVASEHATSCVDARCNNVDLPSSELGSSPNIPVRATLNCASPAEVKPPDMTATGKPDDGGIATTMDATPTSENKAGGPAVMTSGGSGGSPAIVPPAQAGTSGSSPVGPCRAGLELRDGSCMDVDECANGQPCGTHGSCENSEGAYACHCEQGYAGERGPCTDIDECKAGTSGCAGSCSNDEGGFHCECQEGSWLKADGKGCARFSPVKKLNLAYSAVMCTPQVAIDEMGRGLAVWVQGDDTATALWTNRYTPGVGWGVASKLPTSGNVESPRVALDPAGNGLVIWVQSGATHKDLWGAHYSAAGKFDIAKPLEAEDAGDVSFPKLALDAKGNGFAIWTYVNGSLVEIWGDRWLADPPHFLGAGRIVGSEGIGVGPAEISLDASGAGSMVWTQWNITDAAADLHFAPWTGHFDATTGWGFPRILDLTTGSAVLPDVQLEAHGSGSAVWRRVDTDGGSIMARRLEGSTLSATKLLSPSVLSPQVSYALAASQPRVASSPAGNLAAIWSDTGEGGNRVYGSTNRGSTSEWTAAVTLSPSASTLFASPQVALDADGYGFGIWPDYPATNTRVIRAQRIQPETGFGTAVEIDSDLTPNTASPVRFALDAQGAGLLVWDRQNAMQYEVWATRLE